jgi:hypothetical protein
VGPEYLRTLAARAGVALALSVLLSLAGTTVSAVAKASWSAHGSAEQVYATGLPKNAKVSLLNSSGHVVRTKSTDPLGGVLFRLVKPGKGYRVRLNSSGQMSGALTVHSDASAPWDPKIYNQKITDCGYQYLTTRDGIKLALTVHPPTEIAGVAQPPCATQPPPPPAGISDADRVLGICLRGSGGPDQRDRRSGQHHGVRRCGRQYARHGLLRGRV